MMIITDRTASPVERSVMLADLPQVLPRSVKIVLLLELINATAGIYELLLTGEERVAL